MLTSLIATATALETIDERLLRCGISRRSFLVFCSSLMIAAPYGLAITDKKTPEEVAAVKRSYTGQFLKPVLARGSGAGGKRRKRVEAAE